MSIDEHPRVATEPERHLQRLRAWVKLGLLEFWLSALPDDQVVVKMLRASIVDDWPGAEGRPWPHNRSDIEQLFEADSDLPISRLRHDYRLSIDELFIVALLGELQADHTVNLAVSELQLPDRSAHLSVHLAVALIERLFADATDSRVSALTLLDSTLLRDHIITLSDDATLPLCKLQMPPIVWAVLCGHTPPWPGCRYIDDDEVGHATQASTEQAGKLSQLLRSTPRPNATLVIRGVPHSGRLAFAGIVANALGLTPLSVPEQTWTVQSALPVLCLYAGWLPVIRPDTPPGQRFRARTDGRRHAPLAVIVGIDGAVDDDELIEVETTSATAAEREQAWAAHTDDADLAHRLGHGAILGLNSIKTLTAQARQLALRQNVPLTLEHVQEARRHYGAEKLRALAEPVHRTVRREAMAFTEAVQASLDLLLRRARRREAIWRDLGTTLKVTPTPGVRALFVGESGTGKTLAASYIATELGTPLYRVDLASVMNKYIGESEKNLSQLLDYAAATDVALLFDEADSLFGTRSEGKETGERFANMLTNFLLTRIENHPGLVILTTNGKERIDKAFNRRIDVEVDFPLPGYDERLALWHGHLGEQAAIPTDTLGTIASYCDFAGGQVRNAVLAAATYADRQGIGIGDVLRGIRLEYGKLGRKVPKAIDQLRPD